MKIVDKPANYSVVGFLKVDDLKLILEDVLEFLQPVRREDEKRVTYIRQDITKIRDSLK